MKRHYLAKTSVRNLSLLSFILIMIFLRQIYRRVNYLRHVYHNKVSLTPQQYRDVTNQSR